MPQFLKPAPPVVSASASFHADQASRLLLEKREQRASTELATHENTTALIDTVDLRNVLSNIDTDLGKLGHGRSSAQSDNISTMLQSNAVSRSHPHHQAILRQDQDEVTFANLKAKIRSAAKRTVADLLDTIQNAFAAFTPDES